MQTRSSAWLVGVSALLVSCSHTAPQSAAYAVVASFPLTKDSDQVEGRLELLEDARIQPTMREAIAEAYGGDPCADHPAPSLQSFCATPNHGPLKPAALRLVDARGRVVARDTAVRPLASLAAIRLYGRPRRTYLFTVDLSAGFGSYSGPYTRLSEPDSIGFGWVTADSGGVPGDTIGLSSTLKTAWRAEPREDGRGQDLLMVMCRPDFSAPGSAQNAFLVTFRRYTFDGRRWLLLQRQEHGCYESDDDFPPQAEFP